MLCEKCGENEATFHYTETINGSTSEHHLCASCAANTDISYYSSVFDAATSPFMQLLSGIFGLQASGDSEQEDPSMQVQCPRCKMTYGEFVKNSSFGCPTCYDVFSVLLPEKIKKLQGSDQHVGKKPISYRENLSGEATAEEAVNTEETRAPEDDRIGQIEVLSRKMREAVELENYEEAARLRDRIAELKKEGNE